MHKIFYLLFALLFLSSFLKATPIAQELKHRLPSELESAIEESLNKKENQQFGVVWVCNSLWRGPTGTFTYYGWAYNAQAAHWNALGVCRNNNPIFPGFCFVTGCYYRVW